MSKEFLGKMADELPGEMGQTQLALKAFYAGEIKWADVEKLSALDLAEKLDEYVPRNYPIRNEVMKNYIRDRLAGLSPRDPSLAHKNGQWIQVVISIRSQNFVDLDLIVWAGKICKSLGAENSAKKLRNGYLKYLRHFDFFKNPDFDQALDVQLMDLNERRMGLEK